MIGTLKLTAAVALAAALVSGSVSGWLVYSKMHDRILLKEAEHQLVLSELEVKKTELQNEVLKLENDYATRLNAEKGKLDNEYASKVRSLNDSVRRLADVRLRDPGRDQSNSGSSCENSGTADGDHGPDSGQLSRQTTEFLLGFGADADALRERLRICQMWVDKIREENQNQIDAVNALNENPG